MRIHFAIYAVVNIMLIGVWAAAGGGYFWPVWPILGWGFFLVMPWSGHGCGHGHRRRRALSD